MHPLSIFHGVLKCSIFFFFWQITCFPTIQNIKSLCNNYDKEKLEKELLRLCSTLGIILKGWLVDFVKLGLKDLILSNSLNLKCVKII